MERLMRKSLSALGLHGPQDLRVTGLSVDSRATRSGHLFAALPGVARHGAEFADYARRMGAVAVLTDREGAAQIRAAHPDFALPLLEEPDARRALALAAARFFDGAPETLVAVTGTNGKTSVTTFLRQFWELAGLAAVNIGTTGVEGAASRPAGLTTPEPITLHGLLADLAAEGVTHGALEASSHGLAQARLDGVQLAAAGFTNLSRDHLDYHADESAYFAAKAALFTRVLPRGGRAVIWIDSPEGEDMAALARSHGAEVITVGRAPKADLRLTAQRFDATGQDIRFEWASEVYMARLDLIGGFQAGNVLLAAALASVTGVPQADVPRLLPRLATVRGRMQLAAQRQNGATVFVDYAHTPDALATALQHLRPHVMGRLLVVFGAGGDRDPGKRPMMGAAAAAHADVVWITDDNPRGEDPARIRAAIHEAAPEANVIADRAEAILAAVDALGPGDALLIAGKGHETGQIVGTDIFPFDDAEQASIAVAALDGLGV